MQDAGWFDGKNIHLDYRFGGCSLAKINTAAAELVALAPELMRLLMRMASYENTGLKPLLLRPNPMYI